MICIYILRLCKQVKQISVLFINEGSKSNSPLLINSLLHLYMSIMRPLCYNAAFIVLPNDFGSLLVLSLFKYVKGLHLPFNMVAQLLPVLRNHGH